MRNEVGYKIKLGAPPDPPPPPPLPQAPVSVELSELDPFELEAYSLSVNVGSPALVSFDLSAGDLEYQISEPVDSQVFDPALTFLINNDSTNDRRETFRVSIPFASSVVEVSDLNNLSVSSATDQNYNTAWLPLQYWSDGSVKTAQAQYTETIVSSVTSKTYTVISGTNLALTGAFQKNSNITGIEVGAEVRDTFDVPYLNFVTGTGEIVQSTPLIETRLHRIYHDPSAGVTGIQRNGQPRDFLASNFYITEFKDVPFTVVDWVIANDYLGSDTPGNSTDPNLYPLGPVDVNDAYFLASGAQVYAYRSSKDSLSYMGSRPSGHIGWRGLNDTYIGDFQTRRFRFILRSNVSNSAEQQLFQNTATEIKDNPIFAVASRQYWQNTKAFGLLGGPLAGPSNSLSLAQNEYTSFEGQSSTEFGTWGTRGLRKDTAGGGTVLNKPYTDASVHTVQSGYTKLMVKVEQEAWVDAHRPHHYYGLEDRGIGDYEKFQLWDALPRNDNTDTLARLTYLNNGFTPSSWPYGGSTYRTRVGQYGNPHGIKGWDAEHFAPNFMFNYYVLTGDAWAKKSIENMSTQGKATMKVTNLGSFTEDIFSIRAEGLLTQAWTQAYSITRDQSFRDYAMLRLNHMLSSTNVNYNVTGNHLDAPGSAITWSTGNDIRVSPPCTGDVNSWVAGGNKADLRFFLPWQHGHTLIGYLGAYKHFEPSAGTYGTSGLLNVCEKAPYMVEYSWIENEYDACLSATVTNGLRYYVFTYGPSGNNQPYAYIAPSDVDWIHGGSDQNAKAVLYGDGPLGGAHTFLPTGLYRLKELSTNTDVINKADYYADLIRGSSLSDANRLDPWFNSIPAADDLG